MKNMPEFRNENKLRIDVVMLDRASYAERWLLSIISFGKYTHPPTYYTRLRNIRYVTRAKRVSLRLLIITVIIACVVVALFDDMRVKYAYFIACHLYLWVYIITQSYTIAVSMKRDKVLDDLIVTNVSIAKYAESLSYLIVIYQWHLILFWGGGVGALLWIVNNVQIIPIIACQLFIVFPGCALVSECSMAFGMGISFRKKPYWTILRNFSTFFLFPIACAIAILLIVFAIRYVI